MVTSIHDGTDTSISEQVKGLVLCIHFVHICISIILKMGKIKNWRLAPMGTLWIYHSIENLTEIYFIL